MAARTEAAEAIYGAEPRDAVNRVLEFGRPSDLLDIEPGYRFHFLRSNVGSRNIKLKYLQQLRRYYSPKNTRLALAATASDYMLFSSLGLAVPTWAVKSAGIEFCRNLKVPFSVSAQRKEIAPIQEELFAKPNSDNNVPYRTEKNSFLERQVRKNEENFDGGATRVRIHQNAAILLARENRTRRKKVKTAELQRRRTFTKERAARYRCAMSRDPIRDPDCDKAKDDLVASMNFANF